MFSSRVLTSIPSLGRLGRKELNCKMLKNSYNIFPPKMLSFQIKILYLVVSSFVMLGKYFHIIQLNLDGQFNHSFI